MKRIAVLVSGGGTNLQALLDAQKRGEISHGEIVLVVSSKAGVKALERAAGAGVPTEVCSPGEYSSSEAYDKALCKILQDYSAYIVVLAGFMRVIGPCVLRAFEDRIINIHPSLIPSFCGDGYYGLRVHEAALARGVKVSGATVHLVNGVVDGGRILLQKAVDVLPGDTPEALQRRIMEQAEWVLLPQAVEMLCQLQ